jgi:hypothetical protein
VVEKNCGLAAVRKVRKAIPRVGIKIFCTIHDVLP